MPAEEKKKDRIKSPLVLIMSHHFLPTRREVETTRKDNPSQLTPSVIDGGGACSLAFFNRRDLESNIAVMPKSHYRGSPENPLSMIILFAITSCGSPGDPQVINYISSVTPA